MSAVQVSVTAARVTLENGFVRCSFNRMSPAIDEISGDFLGGGAYGARKFKKSKLMTCITIYVLGLSYTNNTYHTSRSRIVGIPSG